MGTTLPNRDWHLPPRSVWLPEDNNLVAANFDPRFILSGYANPAGYQFLNKVWVPAGRDITNVVFSITVAGSVVAGAYFAIYEISGALGQTGTKVATTAVQTTELQSTGVKTIPLVTPVPAQDRGRFVYVDYTLGSATTPPTLAIYYTYLNASDGLGSPSAKMAHGIILTAGVPPTTVNLAAMTAWYDIWIGLS